jgi:hypothetical protein
MSPSSNKEDESRHQWFIVGRWQEYGGEARANIIRLAAIGGFYLIELLNYHGLRLGTFQIEPGVNLHFHQTVTALAAAWTLIAIGVFIALKRGFFPPALKYVVTGCDIAVLTGILMVADGPRSPLVAAYFLVIAVAALRFQMRLVWFATLGSMAGYLVLLGYARWFAGREESLFGPRVVSVPRYQQLIVLLALGLLGIVLGQMIRRVRALAEDYARRLQSVKEKSAV